MLVHVGILGFGKNVHIIPGGSETISIFNLSILSGFLQIHTHIFTWLICLCVCHKQNDILKLSMLGPKSTTA